MPLTDQIKNSTAVHAIVGAGDFVVERIRTGARSIDVEAASGKAQAAAQERVDQLVAELRDLPEQLRALPDKAQTRAAEALSLALTQALQAYGDLAERGEHLVDRIRNQQSTKDTKAQAETTASQAKDATTTVKKSAETSAASTKSRAKATGTSARNTAAAAQQATGDAAKKVGD